ncbi:TetR family transcriptional regulator [Gandjariella thermophila]|uniref:TetR family transcriptional regulator n=1 Tax=Gandjariella thermophila TaxID=1931992 RepID=A0A4D4J098_9PSEU|nr:TetR family transcriptional regulator [Gandjariella thermophila]
MGRSGREPEPRGPDGRRERWRAHREARRAEFVEATVRAVARHGPDVGMDEIAAEAGVSKPVLYRHFTDKADLYVAVGRRATELLMSRVVPALTGCGTPYEWIRRSVDAYLGTIDDYPDLYRFVVRRSFADRPVSEDPVAEDKTMIAAQLAALLGDHLRAFGVDSGGAEPWAHAIVGMVHSAGDWWLERRSMSRQSLTDYLTRLIWHALDGALRESGITIDPHQPLGTVGELRPVRVIPARGSGRGGDRAGGPHRLAE